MLYTRLFRNRWAALFWAAGVLWTAVEVAGVSPAKSGDDVPANVTFNTGDPVADNNLAIFANVMKDN